MFAVLLIAYKSAFGHQTTRFSHSAFSALHPSSPNFPLQRLTIDVPE
jgi:hypothetical protein